MNLLIKKIALLGAEPLDQTLFTELASCQELITFKATKK